MKIRPKFFKVNSEGNVILSEKELSDLIDELYNDGYSLEDADD